MSTADCDRLRPYLLDMVVGELDPSEAQRGELEAHLAGCEACRAAVEELRGTGRPSAALARPRSRAPRSFSASRCACREMSSRTFSLSWESKTPARILVTPSCSENSPPMKLLIPSAV